MSQQTRSERIFKDFVGQSGFTAHRIEEGATREPDYWIDCGGRRAYFEVKELDRPDPVPRESFCPLPYITRKIGKARPKFGRYKDHCCCLVLFNENSFVTTLSPYAVLAAMLGQMYQRHSDEGLSFYGEAMLSPTKNTTISAVITLRYLPLHPILVALAELQHQRQKELGRVLTDDEIHELNNQLIQQPFVAPEPILRATVLKNPHAANELSDTLFRGPFDECWERRGDNIKCTFRGNG